MSDGWHIISSIILMFIVTKWELKNVVFLNRIKYLLPIIFYTLQTNL